MKTVLFIQHGEVDKPGLLAEVLGELWIMLRIAHPYSGDIPSLDAADFDGLVLGGGGQSAYEVDLYPYLDWECELVRSTLASQKPLLGLCLGGHGDVFEIPIGGVLLASSQLTPHQAFRYGPSCYGFQFHLEMTPSLFEELVWDSQDYLVDSGVDPKILIREAREVLPLLEKSARAAFKRWADLL